MEAFEAIFDKKTIESLIPQKQPFVMVDKLCGFSASHAVSGLKIEEENIFFDGSHFVESGLMEHMAQTVALHKGYDVFLKKELPPVGFIGSLKNIEVFFLPKINDEITTEITIENEFDGLTMVTAVTRIDDNIIAQGQLIAVLAK